MYKKLMAIVIIGIAIMTGMASAGVITPTVEDFSSQHEYLSGGRYAINVVNASGLVGDGSAGTTHINTDGAQWSTADISFPAYITFDLGGVYDVATMRIWNCNNSPYQSEGIKDIEVFAGATAESMATQGSYVIAMADGEAFYTGQDHSVSLSAVRYIKFNITSNHGGGVTSLAEVRFEGTLTPIAAPPSFPAPADGETLVDTATTLTWTTTGFAFDGFNVYLDPNEIKVTDGTADVTATDADGDSTNTEFVPPSDLAANTTYYWRVEAIEPNSPNPILHSTPTLSFKTGILITGSMITPIGAVASTELAANGRQAVHSIDSSGLTGDGSVGSTHADGETDMAWTSDGPGYTGPTDYDPEITFDLGAFYDVSIIHEWGYNSSFQVGEPPVNIAIIGPDEVDIYTSTDGVSFVSAGTVNFAQAPGIAYAGAMHSVSLPSARYIKLDIKTNHDGAIFNGTGTDGGVIDGRSLTGLSEIRFYGTVSPMAQILADPTPLTKAAGETAEFTISSANPISYQWYKDGSPLTHDGSKIIIDADYLAITNVEPGDEGNYYCDVSGDGSLVSASAQLLTKRLISHWPLDSDLTDIEGGWNGAAADGDPNFAAGIVGGALDNDLVDIPGSEDYFNFYTRGYTASFWIMPPADGRALSMLSKFDGANAMGFSNYRAGLGMIAYFEGAQIGGGLTGEAWNFVVATYDADTTNLSLYVNGVLVAQSPFVFGASGLSSVVVNMGADGVGLLDDVKIYSYARSAAEVAQEAADGLGITICVTPPTLDIAGDDCVVNLLDLAAFALQWLADGNVYPN